MEGNSVPAVFVTMHQGTLWAGPAAFGGGRFTVEPAEAVSSIRSLRGGRTRGKALLIDAESLNTGSFNPSVVHTAKLTGTDMWLAECIRDLGDLADAFLGEMQKLVIPLNALARPGMLRDVAYASDSCIPMVVCTRGRAAGGGDIISEIECARDAGYMNLVLFDADGSVTDDVIREAVSLIPGTGILSPSVRTDIGGIRFDWMFGYRSP